MVVTASHFLMAAPARARLEERPLRSVRALCACWSDDFGYDGTNQSSCERRLRSMHGARTHTVLCNLETGVDLYQKTRSPKNRLSSLATEHTQPTGPCATPDLMRGSCSPPSPPPLSPPRTARRSASRWGRPVRRRPRSSPLVDWIDWITRHLTHKQTNKEGNEGRKEIIYENKKNCLLDYIFSFVCDRRCVSVVARATLRPPLPS